MLLKILGDESVNFSIIKQLRESGYEVYSILESHPGCSDLEVINYAQKLNALLLTEDKDFGEWVFAHQIKDISVILLCYKSDELIEISKALNKVIQINGSTLFGKFVTVKKNKYRIREL